LLDGLVHPLHRRKGIATELFSGGLQSVSKSSITSAQVSVLETNVSAIGLLNHLGFAFIRHFQRPAAGSQAGRGQQPQAKAR
jgi:ribosomal protein S18 acetylase RimI-like enzyme